MTIEQGTDVVLVGYNRLIYVRRVRFGKLMSISLFLCGRATAIGLITMSGLYDLVGCFATETVHTYMQWQRI